MNAHLHPRLFQMVPDAAVAAAAASQGVEDILLHRESALREIRRTLVALATEAFNADQARGWLQVLQAVRAPYTEHALDALWPAIEKDVVQYATSAYACA